MSVWPPWSQQSRDASGAAGKANDGRDYEMVSSNYLRRKASAEGAQLTCDTIDPPMKKHSLSIVQMARPTTDEKAVSQEDKSNSSAALTRNFSSAVDVTTCQIQ